MVLLQKFIRISLEVSQRNALYLPYLFTYLERDLITCQVAKTFYSAEPIH